MLRQQRDAYSRRTASGEHLTHYNQLPPIERQVVGYIGIKESLSKQFSSFTLKIYVKAPASKYLPIVFLLQHFTDLLELWSLLK